MLEAEYFFLFRRSMDYNYRVNKKQKLPSRCK